MAATEIKKTIGAARFVVAITVGLSASPALAQGAQCETNPIPLPGHGR
jgi:hypothetical protein